MVLNGKDEQRPPHPFVNGAARGRLFVHKSNAITRELFLPPHVLTPENIFNREGETATFGYQDAEHRNTARIAIAVGTP